jgi:hypothetical protein
LPELPADPGLGLYGHGPGVLDIAGEILVAAANIVMFFLSFRVLTPKGVPARKLVPGAAAGGLAWTVLQALGTYVVGHLREPTRSTARSPPCWCCWPGSPSAWKSPCTPPSSTSCWCGGLWPRSIVQPPLTEADRAVLAAQALQNQRRDDQRVHVSYDDLPPRAVAAADFPRTPDEITPPRSAQHGRPSRLDE